MKKTIAMLLGWFLFINTSHGTIIVPSMYRTQEQCLTAGKIMRQTYDKSSNLDRIATGSYNCIPDQQELDK